MGPTWGPPGSCRSQMGPKLAPWSLLSGQISLIDRSNRSSSALYNFTTIITKFYCMCEGYICHRIWWWPFWQDTLDISTYIQYQHMTSSHHNLITYLMMILNCIVALSDHFLISCVHCWKAESTVMWFHPPLVMTVPMWIHCLKPTINLAFFLFNKAN